MTIQEALLILGGISTLLGTITSIVGGIFLLRATRRKENSVALQNEASADSIKAKDKIELSDAALNLVKGIQDELNRVKAEQAEMRAENVAIRTENEKLKARVFDLETENAELKREIEKLKNGGLK